MLIIAGEFEIDPGHRAQAIAAATRMMVETRREPGCRTYVFTADLVDPACFRVFEEWESQAALDAHFASHHMAVFQQAMAGLGVRRADIRKYEIASVGPLR